MEDNKMGLSEEFTAEMFNICRRAKDEAGYKGNYFLQMLTNNSRGGKRDAGQITAKALLVEGPVQSGFTQLYLCVPPRLDLTVEATIVEHPKWHPLFTQEEINVAKGRLRKHHYVIRQPPGASMPKFNVWVEGYQDEARLVGTVEAPTFADACADLMSKPPWNDGNFDREKLTYWGCGLFDNEADARKAFG
jgi:hypothetical protein